MVTALYPNCPCCGGSSSSPTSFDCGQCAICVHPCQCRQYQIQISGISDRNCDGCAALNGTFILSQGPDPGLCCWTYYGFPDLCYYEDPHPEHNAYIKLCINEGGPNHMYVYKLEIGIIHGPDAGFMVQYEGCSGDCSGCSDFYDINAANTCYWKIVDGVDIIVTQVEDVPTPELPQVCVDDTSGCCCCLVLRASSQGVENQVYFHDLYSWLGPVVGVGLCYSLLLGDVFAYDADLNVGGAIQIEIDSQHIYVGGFQAPIYPHEGALMYYSDDDTPPCIAGTKTYSVKGIMAHTEPGGYAPWDPPCGTTPDGVYTFCYATTLTVDFFPTSTYADGSGSCKVTCWPQENVLCGNWQNGNLCTWIYRDADGWTLDNDDGCSGPGDPICSGASCQCDQTAADVLIGSIHIGNGWWGDGEGFGLPCDPGI